MTTTSDKSRLAVDDRLDFALQGVQYPTLVAVLAHLTGDDVKSLNPSYAPNRARGPDDNDSGGLPDDIQTETRNALRAALIDYRSDSMTPTDPSPCGSP